jgi:hypothetical protein
MRSTITFAVLGLLLLALGGVGLGFLEHASFRNFELVYTCLAIGTLFVALAVWMAISRFRYYGTLRGNSSGDIPSGGDTGGSSLGFGDVDHCGHAGGDGASGCDGGGH